MKFAPGILAAMMLSGPAFAAGFACPDDGAIKAAVQKYVVEVYWSEAQREIWKVTDVGGFGFSAIRTGKPVRRDMDYSGLRDVCPAKLEYSFSVTHADGRTEVTRMGAGKTFYFYQDDFAEWAFKAG